jgi:hypothetical protein
MTRHDISFGSLLLLVVVFSVPAHAALRDSAVSAWLFDEGAGGTIEDSFGPHEGEIVGDVEWTPVAKFGAAVEFFGERGVGNRIEIPHDEELSLDSWTITAWVKLQQPPHNDWAIILVKDPGNGFQNYALDLNPQGHVVSEVTNGGSWSDTVSTTSIYDDEWHFVAASYDGLTLRAYVDSVLEAEQDFGPGDQSDAPIAIGDRLDTSQPVMGIIDDVGLFRSALAEDDLSILMNRGLKEALSLGPAPGDFNFNGQLDVADLDALSAAVLAQTNDRAFDLNADGLVNSVDRRMWIVDLKRTYFGDSNLDGEFNSTDFVVVFQAGQYEDNLAGNSTWATGDWNGDREFTSADFIVAFQDGGFEGGPRRSIEAVPEPGGVAWALLFGWLLGAVRRAR